MQYTFTENELKCFYNWAGIAENEIPLDDEERQLIKKIKQIIEIPFKDLNDEEKVFRFCQENGYSIGWRSDKDDSYFLCKKNGKEMIIPTSTAYKKAIQEIMNFYDN
jgi:hypothetical protein